MPRGFVIALGFLLALFAGAALVLNLAAPLTACRLYLCPESVLLAEARRQMLSGSPQGLAASVRLYDQALARNPSSPYRWCDLAEALFASGQVPRARYCFSQALRFGPNIPQTLLRVASFHFRLNESLPTLQTMSRILALVPDYDGLIFSYYDRLDADLSTILANGIPPGPRAAQAYFRHLLRAAPAEDLARTWEWLGSHGFQEDSLAGNYADFLLAGRKSDDAADLWAQYTASRGRGYRPGNFLFNEGFEFEPVRCQFDWRVSSIPDVEVIRDAAVAHSGNWSLRITFRGKENLNYAQILQTVPVKRGRARFRAYVKAAGITTDQGPCFRLFDAESPARLDLRTEQVRGSTEWRLLETSFVVPLETRLLTVQLVRVASLKFDSLIAGALWIDDAAVEPETAH